MEDEGSKSRVVGEIRNGEGYYAAHKSYCETGEKRGSGERSVEGRQTTEAAAPREQSSGRR